MEKSSSIEQRADDRLILLTEQQKKTKEGSAAWHDYQQEITKIIAQNFWRYVNR